MFKLPAFICAGRVLYSQITDSRIPLAAVIRSPRQMSTITKKFINDPKNAVDDALDGLVNASESITFDKNCRRVVLRADYADYCGKGKVALIAGGGSGHEPYAAGYTGPGMLTAAVAGNVFASPPSRHVSAALNSTTSKGGSILFIINYTGDRLHFGLAAERYKASGHDVRVVTIADDVAIDSAMSTAGRRGLAAAVLVLKVAGAMAESGKFSAEKIEEFTNKMNKHAGTMGVSLYPCSVPGGGKMFDLPNDMMEVGLGIHGEPGCRREAIENAHKIVGTIMTKLQKTVQFTKDEPIVLLINNLGGVSQIEMGIIKSEAIKWCHQHNIKIARILCGSYMTSLDGHGISLTVLRLFDSKILEFLDAPTSAPGWQRADKLGKAESAPSADKGQSITIQTSSKGAAFTKEQADLAKKCVTAVCNKMNSMESELNALDGAAGDGDCGSTFAHASKAITERMKTCELSSAQQLLFSIAEVFEQEVGGTGGALYALMLSAASEAFETSITSKDFATALQKASEAVQIYGGAKPGDRTLVDALHGAVEKIKSGESQWDTILEAATKAAQSTAQMKARAGRASYTAKEVQTKPDAGAVAIAAFMQTLWDTIKSNAH
ncbi:putative glycerone kinase [Ancylostoma caninum]|uniref:Triokinase/FMN cyclase n=1 Tax=Ancylostoma caninum TaxID=29170 RepID=A0A368G398_ANCCA|nr:putative glycerone kinase [Ancylostoma caninum]